MRNESGEKQTHCTLCAGNAELFYAMPRKKYYRCGRCASVFLGPEYYVSPEEEKRRYEEHNNNVDDPGYRKFVEPIVLTVQTRCERSRRGLDFGAGTGPVITKLLRENGYTVELFDPFFWNNPGTLIQTYDFIVCCEVMEHFRSPEKEFALLRSLMRPGGILVCMTQIYSERIDFRSWHYKNDSTHVFFYHQKALSFIKERFGFSALEHDARLMVFSA